ncbi:MAG: adenosylcobinamide-GDP ribazoletransferase [Eubacteriales bacterium]|nr:adenosylcobinamide-GDP ribazoletransferase [Eubacteriales bacterium]
MYTRIPWPQVSWSQAGMKYALCFFPLAGAVVGAAVTVFAWLAPRLELSPVACACLGTAIPLLITGGIHMDGFLDTVDARSSFQDRERRLEILKDPHTGAFALIGGGVYLLCYMAVFSMLEKPAFPAAASVFVMTRALSGWSVTSFPKARRDGLASTFSAGADRRAVGAFMALWYLAGAAFFWYLLGTAAAVMEICLSGVLFGWYYRMAVKEFGGITGDLAGYFLQLAELFMLAALALWLKAVV